MFQCSVNSNPRSTHIWILATQRDQWLLFAMVELENWKGSRVLVPEIGFCNIPYSCVSLLPAVDQGLATTLIDGLSHDTWRYPGGQVSNSDGKLGGACERGYSFPGLPCLLGCIDSITQKKKNREKGEGLGIFFVCL